MIEQLKTIREALDIGHLAAYDDDDTVAVDQFKQALTALTHLEAMVGEQEPVHWRAVLDPEQAPHQLKTTMHVVGFREKKAAEGFAAEQIDFYGWRYTIEPLYAAPVAQQYEAGDVASASAQGFRDGVASVAQQPTFDARRALEAIEALLSNIRRDAPSLSGKVMGFAEEVAAALRDKVARQPQARPDFNDEWTGYLKDGETPFERFLRERKDLQSVLKLYQRVLEENERLKGQQPQADTPQATTIAEAARDVGKWLNERPNRPIDLRHVAMLVAHAMQPQAEAVPIVDRVYEAAKRLVDHADFQLGGVLSAKSKARDIPSNAASKVKARHLASLRDALAKTPQQAEAVPPSNLIDPGTVVSFAVDRWLAEVANRPLVNKNRRTLDDTWRQVIRRFGGNPDSLIGPDHDTLLAVQGANHGD